jgi:hypothetical protein
MAANPRVLVADVLVTWDGGQTLVPKGTIVDIPAGSALETAYGGNSNLASIGGSQEALGDDPGESEPEGDSGGGSDL